MTNCHVSCIFSQIPVGRFGGEFGPKTARFERKNAIKNDIFSVPSLSLMLPIGADALLRHAGKGWKGPQFAIENPIEALKLPS